jgi:replicative DNA helicase
MSEPVELAAIHAERTILGAILLENSAFYDAAQELRADEFYLDSHRRIYACISRLMSRGSAADITTVSEEFRATGELDAVGGFGYIVELETGVPRNFSIASYVRLVKEKALLREAPPRSCLAPQQRSSGAHRSRRRAAARDSRRP